MIHIRLKGWRTGLKKIALTELIYHNTALSLAEAKHCVDQLVNGDAVDITISDAATANTFVEQAVALGAICEVVSGA